MDTIPHYPFTPVKAAVLSRLTSSEITKTIGVIAPIGYGKTLLLGELYKDLTGKGVECHWIGLDEREYTATSVIEAILVSWSADQKRGFSASEAFLKGLFNFKDALDNFLAALTKIENETIFFVDNLNSCSDDNLHQLIDHMIFKSNPNCKFIWSSTVSAGSSLGKAKFDNLYTEIGTSELGFNENEITEILGHDLSQTIGSKSIKKLRVKSEGWPAAIRLAQIVLSNTNDTDHVINSISGTDLDIANLMESQVLSNLDENFKEFLYKISQLRNFSKDMCRYVLETDDASKYIKTLLTKNIFLIPLDRNQQQYRLHNFFNDFLKSSASEQLTSETRLRILSRASKWCEKNQNWHDAIEYSFAANELSRVSQLLTAIGSDFVREQGDIKQHMQWILRLQNGGESISIETRYWLVWALVFQKNYERGRIEFQHLNEHYQNLPKDYLIAKDFQQRLEHIGMALNLFSDNIINANAASSYTIFNGINHDPYTLSSVMCIRSICLANHFEFHKAREVLATAEPTMRELGGDYSIGWIGLISGLISNFEGDFNRSFDELQKAMQKVKLVFGEESSLYGSIACIASNSLIKLGRNKEAQVFFPLIVKTLPYNLLLDSAALGLEAIINLWDPKADNEISLQDLKESVRAHPPRLSFSLSYALINRFFELGDIDSAMREAKAININLRRPLESKPNPNIDKTPNFNDKWKVCVIYILIASNQFSQAEIVIGDLLASSKLQGRSYRCITLDIAKAIILFRIGKLTESGKFLISAIKKSSKLGIEKPFSTNRMHFEQIIKNSKIGAHSFVKKDERDFFKNLSIGPKTEDTDTSDTILSGESPKIFTPLTKKESELLHLLGDGLSNIEIAAYTNVSESTIKWHFKNLYKKLNTSSRTASVARARELGLLIR
jgi:LuxR family maltose regulon positive regulatory protein